jgi:hypothetical protein
MWAGSDDQRELIKHAGLELMPGELLTAATTTGAALEGITTVLVLTAEDDFNALAATVMTGNEETHVYRLAPRHPTHGVVAPYTSGETVFAPTLTRETVSARYTAGARINTHPADAPISPGTDILFLITPEGRLQPATTSRPPAPQPGDTLVLLTLYEAEASQRGGEG